ncbi:hypothetical protein BH20CHL7_BH20CHL7_07940 [soil metagenome]
MVPWRPAAAALALVIVAACGGSPPSTAPNVDGVDGGPSPIGGGPAACETLRMLSAPADAYRETPIYVGNEQPTDDLRAWAEARPGFEDIWIDRDRNGWVALAFSRDADLRQRELEAAFPGVGVVAFPVEWTTAELEAVERRVHEVLPREFVAGSSAMTHFGVVMVSVGVRTPERVAAVEAAFSGQPVCIDGMDPADAPAPGPQQPAGDGWRLLATERTGLTYRTGIAYDDASLGDLWALSGVTAPIPDIDWQRDVVIWFGAVYGGSCPDLRLDDVVLDDPRRIIHARIVLVDPSMSCDGDANPRAYLVAVERSRLPAPTFAIQLSADDPPGGVPEERTVVDADLRGPGSVAAAGQIHGDPRLPHPQFLESGGVVEPGWPSQYRMSAHCGVEWLGELNGVRWRTPVPGGVADFLPSEWAHGVAMDGSIVLEVLMSEGPDPRVTATMNGHSVVYRPTNDAAPGCD